MIKYLLFTVLLIVLTSSITKAQNSTDELLDAPRAKKFIFLWPSFDNKRFEYELDDATSTSNSKPLSTSLTVAVARKDKALKVLSPFFNPFQYSVKVSDVLLTDPSFQSIGSFGELVVGVLKELSASQSALSSSTTGNAAEKSSMVASAIKAKTATPQATSGTLPIIVDKAVSIVMSLKSSELAEWGYLVIEGGATCVNWDAAVVNKLKELDAEFINPAFTSTLTANLETLKAATSIKNFQTANEQVKAAVEAMRSKNSENSAKLNAFAGDIDSDNFLTASPGVEKCQSFEHYSRIVFQRFIESCKAIQVKREKLVEAAGKICSESDNLIKKAPLRMGTGGSGPERDDRIELGVYEALTDRMRDVTVVMQRRQANFTGDAPEVKELDEKISGIIRIRNYQKWIPEFSTGVYYTNVTFSKYNAKVVTTTDATGQPQTETVLDPETGEERQPFVMAGMLNMTLNSYSGLVHVLGQVGIGTGKNGVSLLAGIGLRLRAVNPIILSVGAIVPWNKIPKTIEPGGKISGQSQIDSDLRLGELGKLRPYIGIQYNF